MGLMKNLSKNLFGGSSTSATYNPADTSVLKETAPQVDYGFLKNYADTYSGLAGQGKTYLDYMAGNPYAAPTAVDQVRTEANTAQLQSTLADIERDTRQRFGEEIMANYMKGLAGGGSASDIAANAQAQIAASGARTAADARTQMYQGELERMNERDRMAAELASGAATDYNDLLKTGTGYATNLLGTYAGGLGDNAALELQRRQAYQNALLGNASNAMEASKKTRDPGILGEIARNVRVNVGVGK